MVNIVYASHLVGYGWHYVAKSMVSFGQVIGLFYPTECVLG